MRKLFLAISAFAPLLSGGVARAQDAGLAKPNLVLRQVVEALPREHRRKSAC